MAWMFLQIISWCWSVKQASSPGQHCSSQQSVMQSKAFTVVLKAFVVHGFSQPRLIVGMRGISPQGLRKVASAGAASLGFEKRQYQMISDDNLCFYPN